MAWIALLVLTVMVVVLVVMVLRLRNDLSREREDRACEAIGFQEKIRLAREDGIPERHPRQGGRAGSAAAARVPLRSGGRAVGGRHSGLHCLARAEPRRRRGGDSAAGRKERKAMLNLRQRRIRNAVREGRVRFEVFRPQLSEPKLDATNDVLALECMGFPEFLVNPDS